MVGHKVAVIVGLLIVTSLAVQGVGATSKALAASGASALQAAPELTMVYFDCHYTDAVLWDPPGDIGQDPDDYLTGDFWYHSGGNLVSIPFRLDFVVVQTHPVLGTYAVFRRDAEFSFPVGRNDFSVRDLVWMRTGEGATNVPTYYQPLVCGDWKTFVPFVNK